MSKILGQKIVLYFSKYMIHKKKSNVIGLSLTYIFTVFQWYNGNFYSKNFQNFQFTVRVISSTVENYKNGNNLLLGVQRS